LPRVVVGDKKRATTAVQSDGSHWSGARGCGRGRPINTNDRGQCGAIVRVYYYNYLPIWAISLPQISPLTPPPQCPHPPEPALARPAQLCPENLPSEAKVDGGSRLSERRSLPAHQGQGQGGAFDSPKSTSSTTTRLERKDDNNNKQPGHAETGRMVRPHGGTTLAGLVRSTIAATTAALSTQHERTRRPGDHPSLGDLQLG
jgi:hypothetical protein